MIVGNANANATAQPAQQGSSDAELLRGEAGRLEEAVNRFFSSLTL